MKMLEGQNGLTEIRVVATDPLPDIPQFRLANGHLARSARERVMGGASKKGRRQ